jgi:hypothetical protein
VTIAFDAATPSTKATNGADPWTFTHVSAAGTRGIAIIAAHSSVATDLIAGTVSYGGVTVPRIRSLGSTGGESGRSYIWFLGSGVPTGSQTVSLDFTSSPLTGALFAALTFTAAADIEIIDDDEVGSNSTNGLSLALQYGGRTCIGIFGAYDGRGVPADTTVLSGMTQDANADFGPWEMIAAHQTTPGSSDFTVGYTQTAALTTATLVAIAISEELSAGRPSQGIVIT